MKTTPRRRPHEDETSPKTRRRSPSTQHSHRTCDDPHNPEELPHRHPSPSTDYPQHYRKHTASTDDTMK
ncbi:hypothetical protein BDZ89DRAFT_1078106 [Hymenopellis radicata]|nr:hypothetical protein BDZ89DRAFT_1078106 [Hymenopellis radicata]